METMTKGAFTLLREDHPQDKYLAGAFGISDERRDELCELIQNNFHQHNNTADDMQYLSSYAESKEELAFICFAYGCFTADFNNSANPLAAIEKLLHSSN